jgi:hypothetical protein
MEYPNALPARIVRVLSASGGMTSTEITEALNLEPGPLVYRTRVVDTLPAMVATGKVCREGKRKRYKYFMPEQVTSFAELLMPAESETDIAAVGADPETRRAIMQAENLEPADVVLAIARIQGDARAALIDAQFAALHEEQAVSPVRSEDDGEAEGVW